MIPGTEVSLCIAFSDDYYDHPTIDSQSFADYFTHTADTPRCCDPTDSLAPNVPALIELPTARYSHHSANADVA